MKKYFWISIAFFIFIFSLSFNTALAQSWCIILGGYLTCGTYQTCSSNLCGTNPGICAKSLNCPSCSYPANGCCTNDTLSWTKWNPICVKIDDYTCQWAWQYTDKICSTGDKCIPGETSLKAGLCNCSVGGTYKYCCDSGGNPVNCQNEPPSMQDGTYPPEGTCPGGWQVNGTTVRSNPCTTPTPTEATSNPEATDSPEATDVPGVPTPTPTPTTTSTCIYGTCGADECGSGRRWVSGTGCPDWYSSPGCYTDSNGCPPGGSGSVCGANGSEAIWGPSTHGDTYRGHFNVAVDFATHTPGDIVTITVGQWPAANFQDPHGGQCSCKYDSIRVNYFGPNVSGEACHTHTVDCAFEVPCSWDTTGLPAGDYKLDAEFGGFAPNGTCGNDNYIVCSTDLTLAGPTPTPTPIPKTCKIDAIAQSDDPPGIITVSYSGRADVGISSDVRLFIEKPDGSVFDPEPSRDDLSGCNEGVYPPAPSPGVVNSIRGGCCPSLNGSTCFNSKIFGNVSPGYYYAHCDVNDDPPNRCSGNPFCVTPVGIEGVKLAEYPKDPCANWTSCDGGKYTDATSTDSKNFCVKGLPDQATGLNPDGNKTYYGPAPKVTFSWAPLTEIQMGQGCPNRYRFYEVYLLPNTDPSRGALHPVEEVLCIKDWLLNINTCGVNSYSLEGKPEGTYYWQIRTTNNGLVRWGTLATFNYIVNPLPWFQTTDGDIHANGSVNSNMPSCSGTDYLSKDGLGGSPGVVSWGVGNNIGVGNGNVSEPEPGWQAKTGSIVTQMSYDYLINRLNVDQTTPECSTGSCPLLGTGTHFVKNDVTFTSNRDILSGEKIILFVNGNVHFSGNITVAEGGFFALIAKGDITFNSGSSKAHGLYLTDGTITISVGNSQFVGQGSFIGLTGTSFLRDLDLNCSPAESFSSRPDLFINAPPEFQYSSFLFQEVAP